jgi:hypothetical protein
MGGIPSDAEQTPANEFSDANAQLVAARREAVTVPGSVYEPGIPYNYDALFAADGVRTGFARTSLRP